MADYNEAVAVVNTLHTHLSGLARSAINALADGKMTSFEGLMLGMQGMNLATYVLALTQGLTPELRKAVLVVLERGQLVMPPD